MGSTSLSDLLAGTVKTMKGQYDLILPVHQAEACTETPAAMFTPAFKPAPSFRFAASSTLVVMPATEKLRFKLNSELSSAAMSPAAK